MIIKNNNKMKLKSKGRIKYLNSGQKRMKKNNKTIIINQTKKKGKICLQIKYYKTI